MIVNFSNNPLKLPKINEVINYYSTAQKFALNLTLRGVKLQRHTSFSFTANATSDIQKIGDPLMGSRTIRPRTLRTKRTLRPII